jgi:hypothetical protein
VSQRALLLTATGCVLSIASCACGFANVILEKHDHSTLRLLTVVLIGVTFLIALSLVFMGFRL